MKILLISNMFPSKKDIFHGIFVKNFAEQLSRTDVEIEMSVIKGKGQSKIDKLYKYVLFFANTIYKSVMSDYDLIYIHFGTYSSLPLLAFRMFIAKPIVVNVHGSDVLPKTFFSKLIYKATYKFIKKSAMIVVPSKYFKKIVIEKYGHDNVVVSPSGGINGAIFKPVTFEKENNSMHLGYIGRIEDQKGWDVLLKAAKHLLEQDIKFHMTIVGNGKQYEEMSQMLIDLSLINHVTLLGSLPQTKLPEVISTFDIFCFPTMRKAESLGLVGIEAMSCGVPVLGSNMAGLTDYIRHEENGYLVEPGDPKEITESVIKYSKLTLEEKTKMKQSALEMAKNYESEFVALQLYNKLKELV